MKLLNTASNKDLLSWKTLIRLSTVALTNPSGFFSPESKVKNPPEGMTPKLVRNMTDSDLLDMHYFLTEDDDLEDDEFEEGFYIDLFYHRLSLHARSLSGHFSSNGFPDRELSF